MNSLQYNFLPHNHTRQLNGGKNNYEQPPEFNISIIHLRNTKKYLPNGTE